MEEKKLEETDVAPSCANCETVQKGMREETFL
jgi:hypothetical protein